MIINQIIGLVVLLVIMLLLTINTNGQDNLPAREVVTSQKRITARNNNLN